MCDKIGLVMKKITKSALLISVLLSAGVVFSAETYKNSILDMSMKKELNNTVSLTFFTSKPYNENLFITKRNATTYVILFPETNTDIKKEISRAETDGLIQKIDVKTQPYNDQNGKGYTKVVLTTPENTTVLAKTEVYNSEAQIKKTAETALPPTIKMPEQTDVKTSVQEKQVQTQPKTEQKTTSKYEQQQKFDIIKPEKLQKVDNNKVTALPDIIKKEEIQEEPSKAEPQQEEQSKLTEDMPLQETDTEELPPLPEKVKKVQKSELTLFFESKVFWGSAVALVLLLFVGLYINARKKMKEIIGEDGVNIDLETIEKRNQENKEQLEEDSVNNDDKDSKVNLYRLLNASEENEPQEVEDTYSDELANLLNVQNSEDNISENTGEEILSQASEEDIVFDDMVLNETAEISENIKNIDNNSIETEVVLDDIIIDNSEKEEHEDDLFELSQEKTEVNKENITPENSIDDYMRYLADNPEKLEVVNTGAYEESADIVSKNDYEESTEQEIVISDMTDDEIKLAEDEQNRLQEIYEEFVSEEDENSNTEFAADEIKIAPPEFEQSDADSIFEREDFVSNIMQSAEEEIEIQNNESDYEQAVDNEPIFTGENNVLDLTDYKQTVKIHQPVINPEEEEIIDSAAPYYAEEHDELEANENSVLLENGLKVVSQVQIKKNAGLYMVDYEGNHSLVGFKNDNYYVLKSFNEMPSKELQARLYDKTGQKEQYLVKLGKEKMIVEFNRKEIKHVMDL